MHQKGNILIGILIGLIVAGGLFGVYYLGTQKNKQSQTVTEPASTISSNTQVVQPISD